jgi:hypothetical protein
MLAAWDLADTADVATWFQHGTGLAVAAAGSPTDRGAAGDFTVAPSGPEAVAGIWPASIKSLTLSTKHGGRFTSPTVRLDKEYELRVLAAGDDGATLRPVIQYYPRQGEIYPIKKLSRDWQWHTFNLTYWKGDDIHVELATARDMPLPIGINERSWFAVRKAVLVEKEPAANTGPTATPSAKSEMTKSAPTRNSTRSSTSRSHRSRSRSPTGGPATCGPSNGPSAAGAKARRAMPRRCFSTPASQRGSSRTSSINSPRRGR